MSTDEMKCTVVDDDFTEDGCTGCGFAEGF
jgi:hypothetical protein